MGTFNNSLPLHGMHSDRNVGMMGGNAANSALLNSLSKSQAQVNTLGKIKV